MRIRSIATRIAEALIALAAAGCSLDVNDPSLFTPVDIQLDFCSDDTPIWFAYQNGNGPWTVITPDGEGTFTVPSTNRTGVAYVRQNGTDYRSDMIFTTNAELEEVSGVACLEEGGAKVVNGTVSGVSANDLALVGMSFASVFLTSAQTSFSLTQLVERPLDLVASRVTIAGPQQQANRSIIRRTQNPLNGSTMAVLDFSTEGVVPAASNVTVDGILAGDQAFLVNNFFSQLETSHILTYIDAPLANGTVSFVSIPTSELAAGDYHDLFVTATTTSSGTRGVERYFTTPANQTLTLGPVLAPPLVTQVVSTPNVRLRTQFAGQVEYSSMVVLDFEQTIQPFSAVNITISVTASYFGGTPLTWDLTTPTLNGVQGWQTAWGLQGASEIFWVVTAYLGRPELVLGARPVDGETVQFASRMSSTTASGAFAASRSVPRPRHFARLR